MANVFDLRDVRLRVLITAHNNLPRPTHDVRIGHDPFTFDHEARAAHAPHRIETPRSIPHGLLRERHNLNDGALRICSLAGHLANQRQKNHQNRFLHSQTMRALMRAVKFPVCFLDGPWLSSAAADPEAVCTLYQSCTRPRRYALRLRTAAVRTHQA